MVDKKKLLENFIRREVRKSLREGTYRPTQFSSDLLNLCAKAIENGISESQVVSTLKRVIAEFFTK